MNSFSKPAHPTTSPQLQHHSTSNISTAPFENMVDIDIQDRKKSGKNKMVAFHEISSNTTSHMKRGYDF